MSWAVHIYWLLWIVLGFGVPEAAAVWRHRRPETFSNSVWVWIGTYANPKNRVWRLIAFVPFWLVLGLHFAVGLPAWPYLIVTGALMTVVVLLSTFVWKERS